MSSETSEYIAPFKFNLYLYKPSTGFSFPMDSLCRYLEDILGGSLENGYIEIRDEFLQKYVIVGEELTSKKHTAELLAKCRIEDIKTRDLTAGQTKKTEIFHAAMELSLLDGIPPERCRNYLYHGPRLMECYRKFIPKDERTAEHIHLIFTDRILCTWDHSDARYHARAIMLGFPHLISMPGIVEAPARPREYYIKRHLYSSSGLSLDELEAEFAGQYLIYKDERSLEVLKGYALQAVFYSLFKDPFCTDPSCRLFNAHWQAELLKAQLDSGKLCVRHQKMIEQWVDAVKS